LILLNPFSSKDRAIVDVSEKFNLHPNVANATVLSLKSIQIFSP